MMKKENSENLEIYREIALRPYRYAAEIMDKLDIDLNFYKFAKYANIDDPKSYFIYGTLRIVKKSCLSLLHKSDYVCESTGEDPDKYIMDEADESMNDDENFLIRRLIETLLNAINFRSDSNQELYMLFLNLENLELFIRQQQENKEYYNMENSNLKSSIEDFANRIAEVLDKNKNKDFWFLDNGRFKKRRLPLFSSIVSRFNRALNFARPEEKAILGMTYNRFYTPTSLSVHSSFTSSPVDYTLKTAQHNFIFTSILCTQIANVAKDLLGMPISEQDRQLTNDSKEILDKNVARHSKNFDLGDIVLAAGDLAEITEKIQGNFGYTAYKVKYFGKPPISHITEDYWPSIYVIELIKKNNPRDFLNKFKGNKEIQKNISFLKSQSNDKLFDAFKKTLIELNKMGVLHKVLYGNKS